MTNITYDPRKNNHNLAKHGVSFDRVAEFDFSTAHIIADERRDYKETRLVATGYMEGGLHVLCFVKRDGIRVISFRKANRRERRAYEQAKETSASDQ